MLSTDMKILNPGSSVGERMASYGERVDSLEIIVFSPPGYSSQDISPKVKAVPTNSKWRILALIDGFIVGTKFALLAKRLRAKALITSQDGFTHLLGLALSNLYGLRLEVQVHTDIFSKYFRNQSWATFLQYLSYQLAILLSNSVRVVSKRLRENILRRYKHKHGKVFLLPVALDPNIFKNAEPWPLRARYGKFQRVILCASRLTKEKNLELAVSTLAKVREKYPDTGLVIVGEGSERESLTSLVATLGLGDWVVFLPWLSSKELAGVYKVADVFLLTSNFEGYGLTLVEAAISGVPIVTTDVGLVGSLVNKHNALIAEVGDANKLAKHIMFLFQNPQAGLLMRDRLIESTREYPSVEAQTTSIVNLWEMASATPPKGLPLLIRYLISGGSSAFVALVSLTFFVEVIGLWYIFGSILAFLVGFLVSFLLQKHWTFEDKAKQVRKQMLTYLLISVTNLGINTLLMYIFVDLLGLWYILSWVIAGALIAISSLFVYRKYVFLST